MPPSAVSLRPLDPCVVLMFTEGRHQGDLLRGAETREPRHPGADGGVQLRARAGRPGDQGRGGDH